MHKNYDGCSELPWSFLRARYNIVCDALISNSSALPVLRNRLNKGIIALELIKFRTEKTLHGKTFMDGLLGYTMTLPFLLYVY